MLATLVSYGSETAQAMGSEAKEGCCGGCSAEAPVAAATTRDGCCEGAAKAETSCCSESKKGCDARVRASATSPSAALLATLRR